MGAIVVCGGGVIGPRPGPAPGPDRRQLLQLLSA